MAFFLFENLSFLKLHLAKFGLFIVWDLVTLTQHTLSHMVPKVTVNRLNALCLWGIVHKWRRGIFDHFLTQLPSLSIILETMLKHYRHKILDSLHKKSFTDDPLRLSFRKMAEQMHHFIADEKRRGRKYRIPRCNEMSTQLLAKSSVSGKLFEPKCNLKMLTDFKKETQALSVSLLGFVYKWRHKYF